MQIFVNHGFSRVWGDKYTKQNSITFFAVYVNFGLLSSFAGHSKVSYSHYLRI